MDSRGDQDTIPDKKRLQHAEKGDFAPVCCESDLEGINYGRHKGAFGILLPPRVLLSALQVMRYSLGDA